MAPHVLERYERQLDNEVANNRFSMFIIRDFWLKFSAVMLVQILSTFNTRSARYISNMSVFLAPLGYGSRKPSRMSINTMIHDIATHLGF